MPEGSAAYFTAIVIFYLINAAPSALFGIALARRAGRPWWHGVLPGFFLPWFGLLFLGNQPSGTPYRTGPARYSMIMLFVAGLMVLISIFLTWVTIDGRALGQSGELEYAPNQVVPLAVMVWALALGPILASIGLLFGGGYAVAIATGVLVSVFGGLLAAGTWLFGPAGLFLAEAGNQEVAATVGPGGWLALVALITAYWAVLVLPFGLKTRRLPEPRPENLLPIGQPQQPAPHPQQHPGATW